MLTYNYKEKLFSLRVAEAKQKKKELMDNLYSISSKIDSCNSVKELQKLRIFATQAIQRLQGLRADLQPFGLWRKEDDEFLSSYVSFWAE